MTARPHRHEQGLTLIMSLIMLVLLTLLALTSINLGNSNLQIVGNMQQREQAIAAANQVLEETISSTRFVTTPDTAVATPCDGPNVRCVDVDGDGNPDVKVALTPSPACVKAQTVKTTDLDMNKQDDVECSNSTDQNFGVAGATDGSSQCGNTIWDVTAVATDVATQATVTVTQGVALRVSKDDIVTNCK